MQPPISQNVFNCGFSLSKFCAQDWMTNKKTHFTMACVRKHHLHEEIDTQSTPIGPEHWPNRHPQFSESRYLPNLNVYNSREARRRYFRRKERPNTSKKVRNKETRASNARRRSTASLRQTDRPTRSQDNTSTNLRTSEKQKKACKAHAYNTQAKPSQARPQEQQHHYLRLINLTQPLYPLHPSRLPPPTSTSRPRTSPSSPPPSRTNSHPPNSQTTPSQTRP